MISGKCLDLDELNKSLEQPLCVFVLPISGGGFVTQLAILQHLCESKYLPNLILSASGGNVAAYVGAAADWKWAGIERISRELSQNLFVSSWSRVATLSKIFGYFKGNFYNRGSGVYDFLNNYFNSTTIQKYEIWTGTYNSTRSKARLFCNRSAQTSILDPNCIDNDLTQSLEPIFNDGNITNIADAGVASASIPSLVPPQIILNEEYVDAAIAAASPLTFMKEPILDYLHKHDVPLHLIYINSVDLANPNIEPINNVLDTIRRATSNLVRSQTVIDRLAGYELLRCHGTILKEEFVCNYDTMQAIREMQTYIKYLMIEIYPKTAHDIDLTNFNGEIVVEHMKQAYKDCCCRLYWVEPKNRDYVNQINYLINICKGII